MEWIVMIQTKLAKRELSKKEQLHLTACGINSMEKLIRTVKSQEQAQLDAEKKHGSDDTPFFLCRCAECHAIAGKLGILERVKGGLNGKA